MPSSAVDWLAGSAAPLPLDLPNWAGALPLGNFGGGGGFPLSLREGGALPLGGLATTAEALPFTYVAPGQKKREREEKAEKSRQVGEQAQAVTQAAQRAQGRIGPPAPGGDAAAQIMALAQQRYGPEGAKVVGALLAVENGLGGDVGDTDISAVGSHGPFQFYGPGGQLDAYARALGTDLRTAGAQARANPVAAAEWAFNNYLGQALGEGVQQGLTGEALLRRVLSAQNSGALSSPRHYNRYRDALNSGAYLNTAAPVGPPAPAAPGSTVFPVVGYRGPITPHWGGTPGGMDIMAPAGTPIVAMRGGTVTSAGHYPRSGGNYVEIRGDDGNLYYYAHMQNAPLVRAGQPVTAGTPLGAVGTTGNAAGTPPHLHIGIGPTIYQGTDSRGGTGGAFDATSLLRAAYDAALAAAGAP